MNNVSYDKTTENLRNITDIKLVNNKEHKLKWTSITNYMSPTIFDNNLVVIHKSKVTLKLNKPAHIELYILQLSKVLMNESHYNFIKNKYDTKSKLLFTTLIV